MRSSAAVLSYPAIPTVCSGDHFGDHICHANLYPNPSISACSVQLKQLNAATTSGEQLPIAPRKLMIVFVIASKMQHLITISSPSFCHIIVYLEHPFVTSFTICVATHQRRALGVFAALSHPGRPRECMPRRTPAFSLEWCALSARTHFEAIQIRRSWTV